MYKHFLRDFHYQEIRALIYLPPSKLWCYEGVVAISSNIINWRLPKLLGNPSHLDLCCQFVFLKYFQWWCSYYWEACWGPSLVGGEKVRVPFQFLIAFELTILQRFKLFPSNIKFFSWYFSLLEKTLLPLTQKKDLINFYFCQFHKTININFQFSNSLIIQY